jgi:hypothetical protein
MVEAQKNKDDFTFNLSGFLSASRSVLQYALKEAENKKGGRKWYNKCVMASPVLKFFKDKRDANIHIEPIQTQAHHSLRLAGVIAPSGLVSFVVFDQDGNIKQQIYANELERKLEDNQLMPEQLPSHDVKYKFSDWNGSEDVLMLCQTYIQELEQVVGDGIFKQFITG